MTSTGYRPQVPLERVAATEADGDQRAGPGVVWGEVHDGNAYALGGVSGHAGLFGTAADLGRFATALLTPDRHPVLSAGTLALMTARRAGAGAEARVLGWRLNPEAWGRWPAGTIWHTGFTGTSLLVAPALDVAVVLLTNAVHPVRRLEATSALRASLHRAIRDALDYPGADYPEANYPDMHIIHHRSVGLLLRRLMAYMVTPMTIRARMTGMMVIPELPIAGVFLSLVLPAGVQ